MFSEVGLAKQHSFTSSASDLVCVTSYKFSTCDVLLYFTLQTSHMCETSFSMFYGAHSDSHQGISEREHVAH